MKCMNNSNIASLIWMMVAFAISLTASGCISQTRGETNSALRRPSVSHKDHSPAKPIAEFKHKPSNDHLIITFEKLGGFEIKVEWVMNPTNSAADSLNREGKIPARLKALDGKKVSIAGYMKPIKQDDSGATEFLLVPNYFTCCDGQNPVVNQWVHVMSPRATIPLSGERPLAVRGVLRVGEKLAGSNVVSIYRLDDAELESVAD